MSHEIAYDSLRKWVRWDRHGDLEKAGVEQTIITWSDYNKLIEYVYWVETNVCELYGPDAFYSWCYGSDVSEVKVAPMVVAGQRATVWKSKFMDTFEWVSQDAGCLPLSTSQAGAFTTNFFNTTVGAPPSSTWDLPSVCKQPSLFNHKRATNPTRYSEIRP